jgi:type II secretion system protein N
MDRILEWLTAPLPRAVRYVVLPIVAVCLVVVFIFLGFPYDVLADRAVNALERQTGAVIRYGEVEPRLTVGGPGFRFHRVDVQLADGQRYQADPVSVRPAWSTSWLTGSPQLRAFMISDHGSLAGFVTVGRSYGWDGRIVDLDLAILPIAVMGQEVVVEGRADIEADVVYTDGAATGELALKARTGEVVWPTLPMPIEFETIEGSVVLGDDALARVDSLVLEGPIFAGSLRGSIGRADQPTRAPLDIAIGVDVREPGMRQMAKQFGLPLDAEGHADFDIGGTLAQPELR